MIIIPADEVMFLLNQIKFYEFRRELTNRALDILPDAKDKSYHTGFRLSIIEQRIQLVTELLQITEMLNKLETALKEVLP